VARNSTGFAPFGNEIVVETLCDPIVCGANQAPDCSYATASLGELWPADGHLVPITVSGVTDPDGDPVELIIRNVEVDEERTDTAKVVVDR
jgi:hypothetical protein